MINSYFTKEERQFVSSIAEKAYAEAKYVVAKNPGILKEDINIPSDYQETYEDILRHYTHIVVNESCKMACIYKKFPANQKNIETCTVFLEMLAENLREGILDIMKLKYRSEDKNSAKWRRKLTARYCKAAGRIYSVYDKQCAKKCV